ncbi:hypothetical protein LTR91_000793 [Friedmanniomyces endolithicus]|uniref:Heme haloperoxidase family profile domain-containing protein n=1 Tax=Friedmanniomyces endolithicus TaxID=329885 RepID=A0AAN6R2B1_9PEZI|nr:hypothetical protein LTR94_001799 [Friedmanniomyces endolithicus]KAK0817140.1 hypothetical protein LTR38_001776 [Friedmanniomyces endolithicus]KAK0819935.1 hypothetical protein LTR75_001963 [Friedmanniomyces endolithicus]KAK0852861.1 hypothetical protein LTR03_003295 [Friedmanniomyces endolithicus]KAK0864437.1 hypothetical protein LTS02_005973 [Friedmanniomyces endolithicus]
MITIFASWALVTALFFTISNGQCPDEVALYNYNLRTASANNTWFLVPVPKQAVQSALDTAYGTGLVTLTDLPANDASLFPRGFDSTTHHPVLVSAMYQDDIRMGAAKIQGPLLGGGLNVPNGVEGAAVDIHQLSERESATASTLLEGFFLRLGLFIPNNAAFQRNDNNILSNTAAWLVASNPVSGPGYAPTAYDFQFTEQASFSLYTAKLFKSVINQASILSGPDFIANLCQRNQYYFNNDTSTMTPVTGNVTFGPAADGLGVQMQSTMQKASSDGSGLYLDHEGFTGCGQNVGFNPENCDAAAANVDQSAL